MIIQKRLTDSAVFLNGLAICLLGFAACGNQATRKQVNAEQVTADTASLSLSWKTDTLFTGSESTLYDEHQDLIFVTCGNTSAMNGTGFISLLKPDGTVKTLKWLTGFDAPKGLAFLNGKLYVSDKQSMKVIDTAKSVIEKTIPVDGAIFLNDVASDGTYVYFSDSRTGRIFRLNAEGTYEMVIENSEGINGLACSDNQLYALDNSGLKRYNTTDFANPVLINAEVTGGDGLVILNDSAFIASRWHGEIFLVTGNKTLKLLDTQAEKSNTADIGFIPAQRLLLVPTFTKHGVAAYVFKQ